jgi:protein-L-isoaspartate(D-aspartate) O-methyltransferase
VKGERMSVSFEKIAVIVVASSMCIFCAATCGKEITPQEEGFQVAHENLMATIEEGGVKDKLVLAAMRKVKRHLFVDPAYYDEAYNDYPLPIGEGQTISQPSLVAKMTELLELKGGEKVLEIGTGSGYQAAILAEIAKEVYTIEIIPTLAESADKRLKELGYKNITVRCGDGYRGWKEKAPFDAIIVTCGAPEILQALVNQLRDGGIMVSPVGEDPANSTLKKITRRGDSKDVEDIFPVGFVPMTGEVQKK